MKFTKTIKQKGFTLIELLVVISIISLLSSVVLAAVNSAREKAKINAFQEGVRQFILATELYKADHGGRLPEVSFSSSFGSNFSNSEFNTYFGQYISTFPIPPFNNDNDTAYLVYEYTYNYGPFECDGVATDHVLILNGSGSKYDPEILENWGWGYLDDAQDFYDGHFCIVL